MIDRLIYLLFLLLSCTVLFAQTEDEYNHTQFTVEDGLPTNEIYSVIQDKKGFMWFATDRGIVRYDYDEFKVYGTNDGLANLLCTRIKLDKTGKIWVNCHQEGLFIYNPITDNFETKPIYQRVILNFDFTSNNSLIFSCPNHLYFKEVAGKVTLMDALLFNQFPSTSVHIKHPSLGSYSSGIMNGEMHENLSKNIFSVSSLLSTHYAKVYDKYLFASAALGVISIENNKITQLSKKGHYVIKTTFKSGIWIAFDKGIHLLNKDLSIQKTMFDQYNVTGLCEDKEGVIWLSTHGTGIIQLKKKTKSIKSKWGDINGLAWLSDNKIYGATSSNHLIQIDPKTLSAKSLFVLGMPQYNINSTTNLIYFRENKVFNCNDQSLVLYNAENINWKNYANPISNTYLIDNEGIVYKNNLIIPASWDTFPGHPIRALFIDSTFYIATNSGCYRYNYKASKDKIIFKYASTISTLKSINSICLENNKIVNSSKELGLEIYDLKNKQTFLFNSSNGLPSNVTNSSLIINTLLFAACKGGIAVIDMESKEVVKVFDKSYGLINSEIKDMKFVDNKLFAAGNAGIDIVDLDASFAQLPKPRVALDMGIVLSSNKQFLSNSELLLKENNIRIKYYSLTNYKPLINEQYASTLFLNNKPIFQNYTNNKFAQFINLSAGNYAFKVKSRNNESMWSEEQTFNFTIKPHFTSTWWFSLFIGTTIIAVFSVLLNERNKGKLKLLEDERIINEKTILAQEAQLGKFKSQVNPHFIYNSLNSIQHLFFEDKKLEANKYISTFSKLLRKGLNYSEKKYITVEEEIVYLKEYLSIESLRFPQLFNYSVKADDILISEEYHIPPHLIQPLLENSIKHAFANIKNNGFIKVVFSLSKNKKFLIVTVEDNGIGLDSSENKFNHQSKGISLVTKQLEIINKTIDANSSISFVDKRNIGINQTGTLVKLTINTKN